MHQGSNITKANVLEDPHSVIVEDEMNGKDAGGKTRWAALGKFCKTVYRANGRGNGMKGKQKQNKRAYRERRAYITMEWSGLGWLQDYWNRNKKVRIKLWLSVNRAVFIIISTSITNKWLSCVLFGPREPDTRPMTQGQSIPRTDKETKSRECRDLSDIK